MSRVIKIVIGVILLGISAFYFLGSCLIIKDAGEDAVYHLSYYLQAEYLGSEALGEQIELNGDKKQAEEGYEFYKLEFQVENVSSRVFFSGLDYLISIDGEHYEDVRRVIAPENYNAAEASPEVFYSTVDPVLPGKAQMKLEYYAEVKKGMSRLSARYYPSWDEDEELLDIILK